MGESVRRVVLCVAICTRTDFATAALCSGWLMVLGTMGGIKEGEVRLGRREWGKARLGWAMNYLERRVVATTQHDNSSKKHLLFLPCALLFFILSLDLYLKDCALCRRPDHCSLLSD